MSQFSLLCLAAALVGTPWLASAVTLTPLQNLSEDADGSIHPRVAQDPAGNIHVVWVSDNPSKTVHYKKGTWTGSGYTFGARATLADVGGFGYASPNITVAPDGTVAAVWSENSVIRIQTWPGTAPQPSGSPAALGTGGGIFPVATSDAQNRFHVVWDGDFSIQYAVWNAGALERRETFSPNSSTRPDIAVDNAGGVHLVWLGGGIKYCYRPAAGAWGAVQQLDAGGNVPQIAADAAGNVHIAWSRDFDIQYVRRAAGSGNLETSTVSSGSDLDPAIAATPSGKVLLIYRDTDAQLIKYALKEEGAWTRARDIAPGVHLDLSARLYLDRAAAVMSLDYEIQTRTISIEQPPNTLVGLGATWRYLDTGANPAGWQQPNFNDGSWAVAPAELGFGEGTEGTPINATPSRVTTYFRRAFTVADPAQFAHLQFRLLRDDGAVVYLNGIELFRTNLPAGAIASSTSALIGIDGPEETQYEQAVFVRPPLVAGRNVLAVEVHQAGTTSNDLSFDLEVRGTGFVPGQPIAPGAAWRYLDDGSDPGTAWRSRNFIPPPGWKIGVAQFGYGEGDEATRVEDNPTPGYNAADTDRYITTFFRRTFIIPHAGEIGGAAVRFVRDDGLVVYLNGEELFRDNMGPGPITPGTPALVGIGGVDESAWNVRRFDPKKLHDGENTLAVEVHQRDAASSDLSFDLELLAYPHDSIPQPSFVLSGENVTLTWAAWAGAWKLETSADAVSWTAVAATPAQNGQGNWQVTVPRTEPQQFFRLTAPAEIVPTAGAFAPQSLQPVQTRQRKPVNRLRR